MLSGGFYLEAAKPSAWQEKYKQAMCEVYDIVHDADASSIHLLG